MPSATDFLPLFITMLMKREISWLPCLGSGSSSRVGVLPFLDMIDVQNVRVLGVRSQDRARFLHASSNHSDLTFLTRRRPSPTSLPYRPARAGRPHFFLSCPSAAWRR